jgi:hypothetical protein
MTFPEDDTLMVEAERHTANVTTAHLGRVVLVQVGDRK